MSEAFGKYGIRAKVVKLSKCAVTGIELPTFEVEYPRMVLAELNTHRMLSRNSASSRAIPFTKMLDQLTARPVRFGQANPGMQDKGEDFDKSFEIVSGENRKTVTAGEYWQMAKDSAVDFAYTLYAEGYHKQVYNRLVEPFQMMKTVLSGTELANFYWLRKHGAADPTIEELALCMDKAHTFAIPELLNAGEWHLPYVDFFRDDSGAAMYRVSDDPDEPKTNFGFVSLEDAIKVSCARCAAVSFRNVDYGVDKSREVFARLIGDERKHASAFEHCATPMQQFNPEAFYDEGVNIPAYPESWEKGVSHMDKEGQLWSGNLRGWVQYRKLIAGENFTGR